MRYNAFFFYKYFFFRDDQALRLGHLECSGPIRTVTQRTTLSVRNHKPSTPVSEDPFDWWGTFLVEYITV